MYRTAGNNMKSEKIRLGARQCKLRYILLKMAYTRTLADESVCRPSIEVYGLKTMFSNAFQF